MNYEIKHYLNDKIAVEITQLKIDELITNSKMIEIDRPFSREEELNIVINQSKEWQKFKSDYSKMQIAEIKNHKNKS